MWSAGQNALIIFSAILLLWGNNVIFCYDWQQNFEITRNLSEALVEIISNVFVGQFNRRVFNFQVKVQNKNEKYLLEYQKIIDETLSLLNDSITIHLRNGVAIPPDNERHFCILLIDSCESLEFLYEDLKKFHLFIEGSFYIVLQTFSKVHHYYDELFKIFQLNWLMGITHADILIPAVQNVILLFHYKPFTQFHCKTVAPIIHNKFINGVWLHKKFIIPKAINLHGCPLVCATWEDMPYFKIDPDHSKGKTKYLGLEGKLLEYLKENMNFTVTLRFLNDEEINETVYNERGIFNKLFGANTDFVIGAFHYKPTSLEDPYAPTTAYYMSSYHFIVSSKTDEYDDFTKLMFPFAKEIWIILFCIFVFVNIFLFALINRKLKRLIVGNNSDKHVYNMVILSLGGGVTKDPKVPFSRFLLMLWLLTTFILRSIYQGIIFHFIKSNPQKPPPRTMFDLMQKNYRIFMSDVVYSSITDLPQLFAKAEVLNTSEIEFFDMLKYREEYESFKLAVISSLEYFGYYKFSTSVNDEFYVLPEKLFTQHLSIYMKKNSAYLKRFNKYIKNYVSEGLMNRWERLIVSDGDHRGVKDNSPGQLNVSQLSPAFRLYFIGLIASLLAIFGEIFFNLLLKIRCLRKKIFKRAKNAKQRKRKT